MKAAYKGKCTNGDPIKYGDDIVRDGSKWRHVNCPDSGAPSATVEAAAMAWALDFYGPEQVYADGEHSYKQATAWAVKRYRERQERQAEPPLDPPAPERLYSDLREWANRALPGLDREVFERAAILAMDGLADDDSDRPFSAKYRSVFNAACAWLQAEWDGTHAAARREIDTEQAIYRAELEQTS